MAANNGNWRNNQGATHNNRYVYVRERTNNDTATDSLFIIIRSLTFGVNSFTERSKFNRNVQIIKNLV
jgi:hypothetical protein